jgi:hypothetical protein
MAKTTYIAYDPETKVELSRFNYKNNDSPIKEKRGLAQWFTGMRRKNAFFRTENTR